MKLCNSPTGVDEQEAQFLAAMQAATMYTIAGSRLELRDDGGALQVSFRATRPRRRLTGRWRIRCLSVDRFQPVGSTTRPVAPGSSQVSAGAGRPSI